MTQRGARQEVRTSLTLGIKFDDFDYQLFLREYHRDLRNRFSDDSLPAFATEVVLDELIPRYEPACEEGIAGGHVEALRQFAQRVHRLDLNVTGSDYGPFEQRKSPYSFDRTAYHLGREVVTAKISMEHPGYNPYRSTRRIPLEFFREHLEELLELLPDYLWWSMHDQREALQQVLLPESLDEVRRRIELSGYKLDSFGLYLTTFETLHLETDAND